MALRAVVIGELGGRRKAAHGRHRPLAPAGEPSASVVEPVGAVGLAVIVLVRARVGRQRPFRLPCGQLGIGHVAAAAVAARRLRGPQARAPAVAVLAQDVVDDGRPAFKLAVRLLVKLHAHDVARVEYPYLGVRRRPVVDAVGHGLVEARGAAREDVDRHVWQVQALGQHEAVVGVPLVLGRGVDEQVAVRVGRALALHHGLAQPAVAEGSQDDVAQPLVALAPAQEHLARLVAHGRHVQAVIARRQPVENEAAGRVGPAGRHARAVGKELHEGRRQGAPARFAHAAADGDVLRRAAGASRKRRSRRASQPAGRR